MMRLYTEEKTHLIPSLKPVGHHSTRLKEAFAFRAATAAVQSRGTTSPRYRRATAMYLPLRGSQTTIWLFGSKHWKVKSWTLKLSCELLLLEMTGA